MEADTGQQRRLPAVLVLLGLAITLLGAGVRARQDDGDAAVEARAAVEALIPKVDPKLDNWRSEVFQSEGREILGSLAELVQRRTPGPAGWTDSIKKGAHGAPLRPQGLKLRGVAGGIDVARYSRAPASIPSSEPLHRRLEQLAASLDGARVRRVDLKIVGVSWNDGATPTTRVRYEAAAELPTGRLQQTAYWNVGWWRDADDSNRLRIASIELESFEEVRSPTTMFDDCTGSVLAGDATLQTQLGFGGEYWFGRIDALGEHNLMGHNGIAVGDVNADGLEDLYVGMGTGLPNLLLVQQADGTVRDTADAAGVAWLDDTKGALFADMDNDGDRDLLVAMGPTIVLCKNDGSGRFDSFVRMKAATPASFYSLSVADYDLDGDLDIYGTRYVKVRYGTSVPIPFHDANNGPTNHLLRNDGRDRYVDATHAVGLDANNSRFSLIGAWADYDTDGDPDLYVANDFGRNSLYRNDDGRFVDVAAEAGAEDQAAGMGASWADYDLDGDLDLYVTNMYSAAGNRIAYQPRFKRDAAAESRRGIQRHSLGNTLLANRGDGTFRDVSDVAGVRMGRWGWGARFVELNNDGYEDLVVPNGFLTGALEDDL